MSTLPNAKRYAAMGLSVIPLRPRPEPDPKGEAKRPALPAWKEYQQRRATEAELEAWWHRWPEAGVAIVTGAVSGVVGIDLDNAEAVAWAHETLPPTPMVCRSGRGEHWYYKHPGIPVANGVGVVAGRKIDIRGDGGYLVAPPSVHPTGALYVEVGDWEKALQSLPAFPSSDLRKSGNSSEALIIGIMSDSAPEPPARQELSKRILAPVPDKADVPIISRLYQPRPGGFKIAVGDREIQPSGGPQVDHNRPAPSERARAYLAAKPGAGEGERNRALHAAACVVCHDFDVDVDTAIGLLSEWNAKNRPPIDHDELVRTTKSAAKTARGPRGAKLAVPAGARMTSTGTVLSSVQRLEGQAEIPTIRVNMAELPRMVDEAAEALKGEPELYQRGNFLVQVRQDGGKKVKHLLRPPTEPVIIGIPIPRLRELLSRSARWVKMQKDDDGWREVPTGVPEIVAQVLAARPLWPFRPLEGIVEAPTIRLDGTVLSAPGYDDLTGLLYLSDGTEYQIADTPGLQEAQDALRFVATELFSDFPFPAEYHRSAAMAALLTVVLRPAIAGPVPLFLLSASTPGAGKGLIAHVCAAVATGRPATLLTPCEREDSFKTAVTSAALSGSRAILYDEVSSIGGPTLQSALTVWTWSDRAYHTQTIVTTPVRWVWFAAGQNPAIAGDMHRRTIQIRLEPQIESPEDRTDFRNPDLERWATEHRGEIVSAILTAAKAFFLAGRPQAALPPYGSYYAWSNLIRQLLVWTGWPDPNLCREEVKAAAAEQRGPIEAMLEGWRSVFGDKALRLADAVADIRQAKNEAHCHDLWSALLELAPTKGRDDIDMDRLGKLFRRLKARIFGGFQLLSDTKDRNKVALWRIRIVTIAGDAGDCGGSSVLLGPDQSSSENYVQEDYKHPPLSPASPALPLGSPKPEPPWPDDEVVDALAMWLRDGHPQAAEMWQALGKTWPSDVAWAAAPADGRLFRSVAEQMARRDHDDAVWLCKQAARVTMTGLVMPEDIPTGNWRSWVWHAQSADTLNPWLAWMRQNVRSLPC